MLAITVELKSQVEAGKIVDNRFGRQPASLRRIGGRSSDTKGVNMVQYWAIFRCPVKENGLARDIQEMGRISMAKKFKKSLCEGYGSPARMPWSDWRQFFCQPLLTAEPRFVEVSEANSGINPCFADQIVRFEFELRCERTPSWKVSQPQPTRFTLSSLVQAKCCWCRVAKHGLNSSFVNKDV